MRRSRRYKDKPVTTYDIESYNPATRSFGQTPEIAFRQGINPAEAQRRAAIKGWINWHMNRDRISYQATTPELRRYMRRVSWRRVH